MSSYKTTLQWAALASYATVSVGALHWPDFKMERLDELIWAGSFSSLNPNECTPRDNTTMPAQWVRLAYHDMSTHNIGDGTGGLDASIAFELDRPQNVGKGMSDSVVDFLGFTNPGVSLADVIAAGTVTGVAACGGPIIPFRGGRVDATAAGPATVPEPQEDLAAHTESFRRQGFSQSEMIGLVACGHSLGGVRRTDFPEIIQTPVDDDIVLFDGTHRFDNNVVTGYLDGTTPNPLVVGPNVTTNSDLRIFASDGNVTMQSIASPDNFNKVCGELFERMVDTVPRGVQLTDVVEPIAYKVGDARLFPGNDGLFRFTTDLRLLGSDPSPSRTVTLFWNDRQGSVCPASGCSAPSKGMFTSSSSHLALKRGLNGFSIYQFDAKINMTSSLSKFWFEVDEGNGSKPVLVDNDGAGLLIKQDTILFDRARSSSSGLPTSLDLVVAVRTTDPSSTVSILSYESGKPNDTRPKRETIELSQDSRFASVAGYMFFSTTFPRFMQWMDIEAEVGGERYHEANVNIAMLRE